jgi:hypothetical protein
MKREKLSRGFALLLSAAVMIGACTACSSSGSAKSTAKNMTVRGGVGTTEQKSVAQDAGTTSAAAPAAADGLANGTAGTAENPSTGAAAAIASQKIIERLSYQIETLKFDDSIKTIQSLCTNLGGYVQDSSVSGSDLKNPELSGDTQPDNLRQASYTLRIPQEKLSQLKTSASKIGNILNFTSSSENVSEKYFDTEARLKSLRTQQESLLALLKKSGSLKDVIELEKALADVNTEIEQLTGSLRQYDSLINFSTVSIQLNEVVKPTELEKTPVTVGDKIAKQFKASMSALGAFGEGLLVFFLGGAPIILLFVVIAAVIIFILRRRSKGLEKKTAEMKMESSDDDHAKQ